MKPGSVSQLLMFVFVLLVTASQAFAASITLDALGDSVLQDDDNNGIADTIFGYGGFSAGTLGAFTQQNKPTQSAFVADRDAIRFALGSLVGQTVTTATLRMVQRTDLRGLQAGTESVFGFLDDSTVELDDYTGGSLLGAVSAPGVAGALVTLDVTAFVQAGLLAYGPGSDVAVFRLQDPVTADTTGNPYSLSFSNDRTPSGVPLQLVIETSEATPVPEPSTLFLFVSGIGMGARRLRNGARKLPNGHS